MAFAACKKKTNQEVETGDITIIPTATPTVAPIQIEETVEEDQTVIDTSESEEEATTIPDENYLSDSEAVKIIQNEIGEQGYVIDLLNDNISIGEHKYYIYKVSDSTSKIGPSVLVDMISGELLCYYSNRSTSPFSDFPLYTDPSNLETEDTTTKFTKEDALTQLNKVSMDSLGLSTNLTEYTIVYDDWSTNVKGVECYGINAFEDLEDQMVNMGMFYVAVDGSVMYKFDSLDDDFVEIVVE
jgi:hypothetical protein